MIQTLITIMPMMVCAILSALLALSLRDRWNRPRFTLLILMLTATALYWAHGIFFGHQTKYMIVSDTIYSFCNPAVFPLFFIYIEELTLRQPCHKRQMAYLLPSFGCCFSVGILYLLMDQIETSQFISHYLYENELGTLSGLAWWQGIAHMMVRVVFALEIPPIVYYSWRHVSQYDLTIENNYSNTEGKLLSNVRNLLIFFAVTSFISFCFNIIGRYQFTDSRWLLAVPSILFSTLLLLIGHVGLHLQFSIKNLVDEEKEYEIKPQPDINQSKLSESIQRLIDEERLYLQPNLKTDDLAKRLFTNKNYIYQAINIHMGLSFTQYINQKRIEYAAQLIEENPKALLTDISSKSGFTSVSAFYRNFKAFKGCSPSAYQLKQQEAT